MASETASDLAFPSQDPAPAAERVERARAVSAELEAIFGQSPPETERPVQAARVARTPLEPGARPRRRFSASSLGAVGAAALAGLAAGALLVKPPARHVPKPHPAALAVEMVPPQQLPQAADAALAEPAPPPQLTAPPRARVGPPPPAPSPARAARHRARKHASSYGELVAADRRLRSAYAEAIRAGAPRPVILADRDRWASLRRRERDPARLAAEYRSLAHHLDRAATEARRREARNSRRSFFHPRFAPWWG